MSEISATRPRFTEAEFKALLLECLGVDITKVQYWNEFEAPLRVKEPDFCFSVQELRRCFKN